MHPYGFFSVSGKHMNNLLQRAQSRRNPCTRTVEEIISPSSKMKFPFLAFGFSNFYAIKTTIHKEEQKVGLQGICGEVISCGNHAHRFTLIGK